MSTSIQGFAGTGNASDLGDMNALSRLYKTSIPTTEAPLSLRVNFSWTFVGNVVYSVCKWGMLAILAKMGPPEMVGRFALGLAVTAPIITFANLQLRAIQATDAHRDFRFGDYLGLRISMLGLALLVIVGVAAVSGYEVETAWVIVLLGLAKAIESVSDVIYGLLQQRERMDRIAKSQSIKGLVSLLALGLGVYFTGSLEWGIGAMILVWALVLLLYDLPSSARVVRGVAIGGKRPRPTG